MRWQEPSRRMGNDYRHYDYLEDPYALDDQGFYCDLDNGYDDDDSHMNTESVAPPSPMEWEEVEVPHSSGGRTKAYVILPPSPPSMHPLPSAVLHFVGGTFFGSAPKTFYKRLLEDIVKNTQCAIVITPLAIITPFSRQGKGGPLDHVRMAQNLKQQFRTAFEVVIEDEYGAEAMKSVPIAGIGHSLGARILVVLATMMKDTAHAAQLDRHDVTARHRRRRLNRLRAEPTYQYKSMILVGFTNVGAAEGIPGIRSLLKQRRRLEDKQRCQHEERRHDFESTTRKHQPHRGGRKGDMRHRNEDEEEDWAETWVEMQEAFQMRADDIKAKLTPQAEDLEFYPTPRQLWAVLEGWDGDKPKYRIPQTLLIQFDRDAVDQSSKLASILASNAHANYDEVDAGNQTRMDLKFARLRGKHLIPVTMWPSPSTPSPSQEGSLQEWSGKTLGMAGNRLKDYFEGSNAPKINIDRADALRDLRQTITRYIADVITK